MRNKQLLALDKVKEFFNIFKNNGFEVVWENNTINNGKSYILKRII